MFGCGSKSVSSSQSIVTMSVDVEVQMEMNAARLFRLFKSVTLRTHTNWTPQKYKQQM